jgi:DNA end-binding protein Ku
MAARKGLITFGLVSIPVALHVAARSTTLDFDLLHAKDKGRIKYKLWCQEEDEEVERAETVKGYKVGGGYVIMDDEDFDKAEQATSRSIDVRQFVDLAAVDPVYLETSYWVGPQEDSERAYEVLLRAMTRKKKGAVVTFVMGRRQHYALLRPDDDKMALHTLYYGDEVRPLEADWKHPKPGDKEIGFAEQLIDALSSDFTPEKYEDEYRQALLEIIRAKAEGKDVEAPAVEKPPAKVRNLMDALRQSVDAVRKPLAMAEGRGAERAAGTRRRQRRSGIRRATRAVKKAA